MPRRAPRIRLDALLVERGLAPDLATARAYVMAGEIIVGEHRADSAGAKVRADSPVRRRTRRGHRYVSRGGLKLEKALDAFAIDPTDRICLDLGASTGGFTDCLLQRGARRVYAVDVGYGLLDWRLQTDARVVNLERTNAADLGRDRVPEPVALLVADISFNSLSRILPPAVPLLAPGADLALLVKPQFEAPADAVGDGGIVRDPETREAACTAVEAALVELGLEPLDRRPSPITGAKGNVEFLLWARASLSPVGPSSPPGPAPSDPPSGDPPS